MMDSNSNHHVRWLVYEVTSFNCVAYKNTAMVEFSNELGFFKLSDKVLKISLIKHFSTVDQARAEVEIFLKKWEMTSDLASRLGSVRFEYDNSKMCDLRNPLAQIMAAQSGTFVMKGGKVDLKLTLSDYPSPPDIFVSSPYIEAAYAQWLEYHEKQNKPIQVVAYFILTCIEGAAGGRTEAAREFNIERTILAKVGKLSSKKGGQLTARNMKLHETNYQKEKKYGWRRFLE